MVNFNGMDFESISPKIRLLDVVVNPPAVKMKASNPAARDGDIFASRQWGPRSVDLYFLLLETDEKRRAALLSDIVHWAYSTQECKLIVPQHSDGYLMAVCSSVPGDSAQDYAEDLTISFRAADPFFQSNEEKSVQVGSPFVVEREAGANWRIVQTVADTLAYPMWTLGKKQISFSSITPGRLEIESKTHTAILDGNSAMPSMMFGSRFLTLAKGENTVTGQNGAGGTIYWRERWI